MRKWIKWIFLSAFLLAAIPVSTAASERGRVDLKAADNDVEVTVRIPEGKTETITSMRLQLFVSIQSGKMTAPVFQFEETINSAVKDAEIRAEGTSGYFVDLILSGKQDQRIFDGSGSVRLGTLSFQPTSRTYEAKVELSDEIRADGVPAIQYAEGSGRHEMTLPLEAADPVVIKGSAPPAQVKSLTVKGKKTGNVTLTWKKVSGAKGYEIYRSRKKNGDYTLLKRIKKGKTKKWSANIQETGTTYYYKVRAYVTNADGKRVYGKFSKVKSLQIKN